MRKQSQEVDVLLIGGGIMSATLGTIIRELEPKWSMTIVERLDDVALESSNAWNNAGTGHAALCELNYTPERPDGSIDITKAITINEQFEVSRGWWQYLVENGTVPSLSTFLSNTPHMTFVRGDENVDYLRRRHQALSSHPLFRELQFSDDPHQVADWAPLLMQDRNPDEPVAATHAETGTDVDFGRLTREQIASLRATGAQLHLQHEVTGLRRLSDGRWKVTIRDRSWNAVDRKRTVIARFVFVGAGGGALPLLQKSGIKEIKGYGGFPISGKFMRTTSPEVVAQHNAKVYGKASVGSPPMSVPHLDTRVVDNSSALMFGPYAGFSTRLLKRGSLAAWFATFRASNLRSMVGAGLKNMSLTVYLVKELLASEEARFETLQAFYPAARPADWELITAGQRVQVIKWDKDKGGVLEFGTDVVTGADGTIAGLLGASPGASTAVPAMLSVLERCFPEQYPAWRTHLESLVPTLAPTDWDAEAAEANLVDADHHAE